MKTDTLAAHTPYTPDYRPLQAAPLSVIQKKEEKREFTQWALLNALRIKTRRRYERVALRMGE
jgi:hypothetical protein